MVWFIGQDDGDVVMSLTFVKCHLGERGSYWHREYFNTRGGRQRGTLLILVNQCYDSCDNDIGCGA